MNLSRIVEHWAVQSPSKVALHFQGRDWSYAELWREIDSASRTIDIGKGDRVAWLGYNSPDMLVLLFALARLGGILVPLNWRLTAAEHREILSDCAPRFLFTEADFEK